MAELSWFFESPSAGVNEYTTSDMAEWIWEALGLRANGIIPNLDNALAPTSTGALNSTYNTGVVIFNGRVYKNSTSLALTHVAPSAGYKRIDAVVVRFDDVTNYAANLTIIVGTQKNDGTQAAPSINSGTDVLVATILIDGTNSNYTTVTDSREFRKHAGDMLPVYSTDTDPTDTQHAFPSLEKHYADILAITDYQLIGITAAYTIPGTYKIGNVIGIQNSTQYTPGSPASYLVTIPAGQAWEAGGGVYTAGQTYAVTNQPTPIAFRRLA